MKSISFFAFSTFILAACASGEALAPAPDTAASIRISPAMPPSLEVLAVNLVFPGSASGETRFSMPGSWGPEENLGDLVSDLVIVGGDGEPLEVAQEGDDLVVRHSPGEELAMSYKVAQDYPGEPAWGVQRVPGMRPALQPDYATLVGHTVLPTFVSPDMADDVFSIFLPAGDGSVHGVFSQPTEGGRTATLPLDIARDGIFLFGRFRHAEIETRGMTLRTAIRGDWALDDRAIAEAARVALIEGSDLFNDAPFTQYLVAINAMPPLPEGSAVIGTGLTDSFFILATPNADAENLRHTIVHEILHEWITRRMGQTDEATDPSRMWFTEGFTEYYTQLVMLRSGMVSLEEFVANMSGLLEAYDASSAKNMTNAELVEQIWNSHDAERLPYSRGALLAFSWDMGQRKAGGAPLADALAALIDDGNDVLTDDVIREALSDVVGARFGEDLTRYVIEGQSMSASAFTLPACINGGQDENGAQRLTLDGSADLAACKSFILGD